MRRFKSIPVAMVGIFLAAVWIDGLAAPPSVGMLIMGEQQPAIVGIWPDDTPYSWVQHTLSNGGKFSWRLLPGTEEGVIFSKAQDEGELLAPVLMFNVIRHFYTTGNGITIAPDSSIDMSGFRAHSHDGGAGTVTDLGSGSGFNTLIPQVLDVLALSPGESGWSLSGSGEYHLIYNTTGFCSNCFMKFHFYGTLMGPRDGDVTLDGVIDIRDFLLGMRSLSGLTQMSARQTARGDLYPLVGGDHVYAGPDLMQLLDRLYP